VPRPDCSPGAPESHCAPTPKLVPYPYGSHPHPRPASLHPASRRSEEEAVAEALALWEERERNRIAFLATLTDARASLARGEGRELTEDSLQELAKSVKERGRARLATELARSA